MTFPSGSLPSLPSESAPAKKKSTFLPAVKPAVVTVGTLTVVLVVLQIVNTFSHYSLDRSLGIYPRTLHGLWGVLMAPLLHWSWGHLLSNLIPFMVLGFLIMVGGVRQFVSVTILVWLISGLGVWLIAPANGVTVGASGLVFGWLAYLVFRGIFTRNWGQIGVGILLLAIWGGIFWTGIISTALFGSNGISWQGHLFGAIGGLLAAFLVARADGPRQKKPVNSSPLSPTLGAGL